MSNSESILPYDLLLDNLNDCVCVVAADSTLIYANQKAVEISGYAANDLIGMQVTDFFHPNERLKAREFLHMRFAGLSVPERYETIFITKDGSSLPVELTAKVVHWDHQPLDIIVFRDITARKSVEEALRESEDKYRFIVENLPVVIWASDAEGNTLYISENVEEMYGYSPEEIYQHGEEFWFGRIHPDDRQLVISSFRGMLSANGTFDIEYRIQKRDGEWIWIHDQALSRIDKSGKQYAYGIFTDITSRRKMEISLAEEHQKFKAIINNSFQFTGLLEPDGTLIEVNDTALNFIGVDRKDVIGKRFWDTAWWTHTPQVQEQVQEAIEKAAAGKASRFQTTHIDSENMEQMIEVSMKPVFDGSHNVVFIVPEGRVITEFIKAQDVLRESEERFSIAFKYSPAPLVISDIDSGEFIDVNDRWVEMLEWTYEEQIGRTSKEIGIWDDPGERDHILQKLRKDGHFRDEPIRFRSKSGHLIDALLSGEEITLSGKQVLLSFLTDVTELKKVAGALRESQERLTEAMEAGELTTWDFHVDTQEISSQALRTLNISSDSIKLDKYIGLIHPDDRIGFSAKLNDVISGNSQTYSNELRLLTPSGKYIWLYSKGKIVETDTTGKPLRVTGFTMDITERKNAEEVLREYDENLEQAMDAGGFATYKYDHEKNIIIHDDRWKMIYAPKFKEYHGMDEWVQLIHWEDRQAVIDSIQNYLAGNSQLFQAEYRLQQLSGDYTWFSTRGKTVKYDTSGKPMLSIGVFLDITERKKAEQEREELEAQLRQAQKMEAIGTLAGGIAHDFNNILTVIIGNLDYLKYIQQDKGTTIDDAIIDSLQAANRAKDLVGQILTFSRKSNTDTLPMDIGPICREALKLLRSSIPTTIEIKQNIQSNLPRVAANPTHVHQIIMNLCTNAVHAMNNETGTITVSLGICSAMLSQAKPGRSSDMGSPYLCLKISDTGTGIPADALEKIFLPYYTTKPQGEGTGLGLAVVHGIVKDLGGDISVHSVVGEGTTFNIKLPVLDYEITQPFILKKDIPTGTGRVLIVDDEPQIVQILEKIISTLGYESVTATDSESARTLYAEESDRIDLVITDYTMPHGTGIELTEQLKQINKEIPVVLITGLQTPLIEKKATGAGICAIVKKPVSMNDIAEVLHAYIKK